MGRKFNKPSKDGNHKDIVQAYRKVGAFVLDITAVKDAFDIIVFYKGQTYVVEIKNPEKLPKEYDRERMEKDLTLGERECMEAVQRQGITYHIVATLDEAMQVLGLGIKKD